MGKSYDEILGLVDYKIEDKSNKMLCQIFIDINIVLRYE